jgi:hypothetical protein
MVRVIALVMLVLAAPAGAQDSDPLTPPPSPPPAPAASSAPSPAPAPSDGVQKRTGIAAEVHLGSRFAVLGGGIGIGAPVDALTGGLFAGYKIDRIVIGLGFDFFGYWAGTGGGSSNDVAFLVTPGIRAALVRSSDGRVELTGQADLGFGHTFVSGAAGTSNFEVRVDAGPGLRYWVHPQLAVTALGGVDVDYGISTAGGTTSTETLISVFGSLAFLGVF